MLPNELIITAVNLRSFRLFFFNQNTKFSDSFFPSSQSRPKSLLRMTYVRSQKAIHVRTRDGEYSPITLFY